ncbi:hypothetical protein [Arachnia propionica]|uniref:hypothetical protein n=1 Tax=Arachnia propionica TaxID=1750 RepID=UPI003C6FBCFF
MSTHNQRFSASPGVTSRDMIDVGLVPTVTAEQRAKAWALLNARGAADLADMLGLTDEGATR